MEEEQVQHLTKVTYTKLFHSFQDLCDWSEKKRKEFNKRGFESFEVNNNQINSAKGRYQCSCSAIRKNKNTDEHSHEGSAALPK